MDTAEALQESDSDVHAKEETLPQNQQSNDGLSLEEVDPLLKCKLPPINCALLMHTASFRT